MPNILAWLVGTYEDHNVHIWPTGYMEDSGYFPYLGL